MCKDIIYGVGALALTLGGAGLAENITSGRGSLLFCLIGFGLGIMVRVYGVCKN